VPEIDRAPSVPRPGRECRSRHCPGRCRRVPAPSRNGCRRPQAAGPAFLQAERLGHVVVTARGYAGDAVLDRVARGQEQHTYVRVVRAESAQHVEAVDVGQHHVEHDDVGPQLPRSCNGPHAVGDTSNVPLLEAQRTDQQVGEAGLVVDDQCAKRCPVRTRQRGGHTVGGHASRMRNNLCVSSESAQCGSHAAQRQPRGAGPMLARP
jgi:hypothetical protein